MKFEKMMMFVGAECRPSFKNPNVMVCQAAFVEGIDIFKPWVSEEQFAELTKCSLMTPFLVTVDVNLSTGKVNLVGYADYDTAVGRFTTAETAVVADAGTDTKQLNFADIGAPTSTGAKSGKVSNVS